MNINFILLGRPPFFLEIRFRELDEAHGYLKMCAGMNSSRKYVILSMVGMRQVNITYNSFLG